MVKQNLLMHFGTLLGKIEELQAAAVDDCQHTQVTKDGDAVSNLALAISARHLYKQCCKTGREKGISDNQLPSLSRFRFQFWLKSPYTHSALNYTGQLKLKYLM